MYLMRNQNNEEEKIKLLTTTFCLSPPSHPGRYQIVGTDFVFNIHLPFFVNVKQSGVKCFSQMASLQIGLKSGILVNILHSLARGEKYELPKSQII